MNKKTLKHVAQFTRGMHQVLPKSKPQYGGYWHDDEIQVRPPGTDWISNQFYINPEEIEVGTGVNPDTGVWHFVYKSRATGKSMTVAEIQQAAYDKILKKYPLPPKGPARFRFKPSIPLGTSDTLPFGDVSKRYRAYPVFPLYMEAAEIEFYHEWFHGLIREGVIRV
jgi:hypothetical protein